MSETILVKVLFPPGSLKKATTIKIAGDATVRAAIDECATSGKLSQPENYYIYSTEGGTRWLDPNRLLTFYGIKDQSTIMLKSRWQIIRVKFISSFHSYVQSLLIDIKESLRSFIPYALKKFQLDAQADQYALYFVKGDKQELLDLDSTFFNLDLPLDAEYVLIHKSQPLPDASQEAAQKNKTAGAAHLAGTVTFDKKKRYIVLEGPSLSVYKDQKEMDKAIQCTDLSDYALQVDEKDKKKLQFDIISTKNKKDTHQFKFEDEKEYQQWLSVFESLLATNVLPSTGDSDKKDSNKVFGAPLEAACVDGRDIPYIVEHCIKYLDEKALEVEGIYRLSGSQVQIDKYKEMFNQGIQVDLSNEIEPHTVAGLLKLYFREMPEPLLTFDLYDAFVEAQAMQDPVKRAKTLWHLVAKLPKVNRATLQYLIAHLIRVEKHSDVNKMAIHNLATVFAPNLLQSKDGDMLRMVEDTPLVNGLVNTFIKDYDIIFSEEEPAEATPPMAKANYDYTAASEKELSFKKGDLITVIKQGEDKGWWFGELNGRKGLFPGGYVTLVQPSQGASKRAKFMQEMQAVRDKLQEENKLIAELEATKAQLQADIAALSTTKERALSDQAELKQLVAAIIRANPELSRFNSIVDILYSQLEAYHKTRVSLLSSKQALRDELVALKKTVSSDAKFKKIKDKLVALIDSLNHRFEEEQQVRNLVDEKKDQLLKDLMQLRAFLNK